MMTCRGPQGILLLGICLSAFLARSAQGNRERSYVSHEGRDVTGCGSDIGVSSCASIEYALRNSSHQSTMFVDGSNVSHVYRVCASDKPVIWVKSVKIVGIHGRPKIGCPCHQETNHLWRFQPKDSHPMITFDNVRIQNGRMTVTGHLVLTNTTLYNTAIWTVDECKTFTMDISHSLVERGLDWRGTEATMGPRSPVGSYIQCEVIRGTITNSVFEDVMLEVVAIFKGDVLVLDSTFSKKLQQETGVGGLNITLPITHGNLLVSNVIFEKQVHYEPIYSAVNIESAALRVEAMNITLNQTSSDFNVTIVDSVFRKNERAISISRGFRHIKIARCKFHDNSVMHAAAAIRLAITAVVVTVKHCEFMNNAAGFNRHQAIPGNFEFDGDQVRITNERINGVISLVGKGGAIRIHKGRVLLHNCTFVNNTARLLGGSVFVDRKGEVVMADSYFSNSDSGVLAMQGDILYSSGLVRISNISFDVRVAGNHVSILRHGGTHWSMDVTQISFKCPVGHRLSTVNATSHKIANGEGLLRSHKLDQLYYYCETCGNNQYSLDRGSIHYAVTGNDSMYMTLMINGQQPFQTHPVLYSYSNITCHDCPYGAHCEEGIKAVANFWGYARDNRITFQHCPPGYCCASTNCPSRNTCARGRVGTLCGQCKAGYSEALFSSNCLPDHHCTSFTWITPVTLLMASIYVLFLMYQQDLRDSITRWTLTWNYDFCCSKCKSKPRAAKVKQTISFKANRQTEEEEPVVVNGNNVTSSTNDASSKKLATEGGCMIILFYYFQDSLLLNIDSVYSKNMSEFERRLKAFLVGLFRFRLDFYQFLEDVCIYPGMQPVSKLLLKSLFVPYVIMTFGFLYIIAASKNRLSARTFAASEKKLPRFLYNTSFSGRLAGGFTLAMLFTYQKLATATFTLLNCVPVADKNVLFLDGTQECFVGWQFAIMTYALVSVVPFSVILMVGPPLIRQKRISLSQFFIGCLFPLPSLITWAIRNAKRKPAVREVALKEESRIVLALLQGPFKEGSSDSVFGQLCWAGVLLARRLILFVCYTFINDVLVRLLCMMSACFIILMHHMYVQPYKNDKGNVAGAFSAAALLVVGAINLLKASFEAAEYIPKGPYKLLMYICVEIENSLVLWLPLSGICMILLLIILKLLFCFVNVLYHRGWCGEVPAQTPNHSSQSA